MATITKIELLDVINEVIEAVAAFADRLDREVEVVLRTDGTLALMVAEESTIAGAPATGFEELQSFDSFDDFWRYLGMAPTDGDGDEPEEEYEQSAAEAQA
jgi:hypothetical protein